MGSSSGRRPTDLDTSQPGVRQIQAWIRNGANLVVQLQDGTPVTGIARWVDTNFLAIQQNLGEELVLINRDAIGLIRALV
jgi:hypothetical protein